MPKPIKKRRVASKRMIPKSTRAKNAAARSRTALAPRPSTAIEHPAPEDEAAFTATVIESGEAARLDKAGKLPAGATLRIVEDEAGKVKVLRRRFSMT